jgi:putative glycosyltransferase (TIGR04372 family)
MPSIFSALSQKKKTFLVLSWPERRERIRRMALKWFIRKPLISATAFLFMPLLFLLFTLRVLLPSLKITVYKIRTSRIGHQISDIEVYLRKQSLLPEQDRETPIFLTTDPANHQLLKMVRRRVPMLPSKLATNAFDALKKISAFGGLLQNLPGHLQPQVLVENTRKQLSFTPEEIQKGEHLLEKIGIPKGAPYLCFISREKIFLQTTDPKMDYSYHDYRDCSIENYMPAIETLTAKGLWAVRLGTIVSQPLQTTNERIIDYATKHRSDFGDIFLATHCKFYIGAGTGMIMVSSFSEVPTVSCNMAPMGQAPYRSADIFILKKYWDTQKRRLLTFREIISMGADRWDRTEQYEKAGIELIENTPDEILEAGLEMNARLDGAWVPQPEDEELQEKYRALWRKGHVVEGFKSRVGAAFLRKHRNLLS